jgi:hypothetical protein
MVGRERQQQGSRHAVQRTMCQRIDPARKFGRIVLAQARACDPKPPRRPKPEAREGRNKHRKVGRRVSEACPVQRRRASRTQSPPLVEYACSRTGPPCTGRGAQLAAQDFRHATAIPPAHTRGTVAAYRDSAVVVANGKPRQTAFRCSVPCSVRSSVLVGMPPPGREFRAFGSSISKTRCRPV